MNRTVLNDDDDEDDADLMVNLTKDRRSGMEDRRLGPNSASQFRTDVYRADRELIKQLQEQESRKDLEIAELKAELATIREWQRDKEETLNAAKIIVHAGVALKFTIMVLIGCTAAIGGIAASMEAFKQWFR